MQSKILQEKTNTVYLLKLYTSFWSMLAMEKQQKRRKKRVCSDLKGKTLIQEKLFRRSEETLIDDV